jgi:hypothetical protein
MSSLRRPTTDQIARQERRARRFARYEKGRALHAQHVSQRYIARQLPMSRTTVICYLRTTSFPGRAQSRRVSLLDPYSTVDPWLVDCLASRLPELVNFASGLQREQPAVQAALDLPYSNGQKARSRN